MIQPFTFQFCTAFRERKQLADKTNEIIDVINSNNLDEITAEIERIDQNIDDLTDRIDQIEEALEEDWILCPSNMDLYDYASSKISHDLKIVYSIPYAVQPTYAQNLLTYHMTGTIYLNKDDLIDLNNNIITGQRITSSDYTNLNIGIGLSISTIKYGLSHDPYPVNIHGIAIDPVNTLTTDRSTPTTINYQTDNMTISNSNPFINIYYKGE